MTRAANLAALGSNASTTGILPIAGGGTAGTNGAIGFKNRIINGAMVIDQRNAGASVTPTTDGTYTLDRWTARLGQASKYSVQQNAGSVTPPVGFINYLGITSTSAYSLLASDYFAIAQYIEGLNCADLGWGTVNAQPVTLSFQVRSSLTGTFGGAIQNRLSNRTYPFTYTINSANTWETKTVTIAGDTTGTWDTNTNGCIYLYFALGMGSNRSGTANSWNAGNTLGVAGATSVVSTNGATFYITGVQLEVGTAATNFDFRAYGTELALCQRYFETSYPTGTAVGTSAGDATLCYKVMAANSAGYAWGSPVVFKVSKRTTPSVTLYNYSGTSGQWHWGVFGISESSVSTTTEIAPTAFLAKGSINSGQNAGYGHFTASAEL